MGWRTVVATKNCKLSYKNGYLVKVELININQRKE